MKIPKYQFYIREYTDVNDTVYTDTLVSPVYNAMNKKVTRESSQMFFRSTISGTIKLEGLDFTVMRNTSINHDLEFRIYKLNEDSNVYEEYYVGIFNKTDCTFDYDKKQCTLGFDTHDNYTNILLEYSNSYDLIKLGCATSKLTLHKRPIIQFYESGGSVLSNFCGGYYWETDVATSEDDVDTLENTYFFAPRKSLAEITVKGATEPKVNGVYGTLYTYFTYFGSDRLHTNDDSYYMKWGWSTATSSVTLQIVFNPTPDTSTFETVLYAGTFVNTDDLWDNDLTLTNPNNTSDKVTVTNFLQHTMYARLIFSDNVTGSTVHDVPSNDIIDTNLNYPKCSPFTGGDFYCSPFTEDINRGYGANDLGDYFSPNKLLTIYPKIERPIPLCQGGWGNASLWFNYGTDYMTTDLAYRKTYTMKDAFFIADVIKAYLKKIAPDITHEATTTYSQFLYGDTDPLALDKFYLFITQKTNILEGEYDQAAQKAPFTFESLMEMLRDCFRCYWFIDDDKRFRVEHISWFMNGGSYTNDIKSISIDTTALKDAFNGKTFSFMQNTATYSKDNLYRRVEFSWGDKAAEPFLGIYIKMLSKYLSTISGVNSLSISDFTPDVDYMLSSPSSFSSDGFALLCPIKNTDGTFEVPISEISLTDSNVNITYKAYVQNVYATWAHLLNYYLYDMPGDQAEFTNSDDTIVLSNTLTIKGLKKFMSQDITFKSDIDPDVNSYIKTGLGNGQIDSLDINLTTRNIKATLLFAPT